MTTETAGRVRLAARHWIRISWANDIDFSDFDRALAKRSSVATGRRTGDASGTSTARWRRRTSGLAAT